MPPLAMDPTEAYLEAMNRLVRIVLTVAALAIGWAPVAQTVHAAAEIDLDRGTAQIAAQVHHRQSPGANHHGQGHHEQGPLAQGHLGHDESGTAVADHPAVCAACVGLPATWAPPALQAADEVAESAPLPTLAAFTAGLVLPPPRA